jgi:DNA-binding transcriptional LysR family regulator
MNFEPASYFFHVLHWRSISKAAQNLGISQPALSRYLKSLEEKVGKKLYLYEDKRFTLTPEGEEFADFLKERHNLEESFFNRINRKSSDPEGTVRLLTSSGVANFWLIDLIAAFVKVHQNIRINVVTTDQKIQYSPEIDLMIGPEIVRPDVESTFLKSYHIVLFASKDYLDAFGRPKTIADLDHHRLVSFSKKWGSPVGDVDWFLRIGTQNGLTREPFLEVNSSIALKKAGERGIGIVALGREYIDQEATGLQEVLPQINPQRVDLYISHAQKHHPSPTLVCFKTFLITYIRKHFPFF